MRTEMNQDKSLPVEEPRQRDAAGQGIYGWRKVRLNGKDQMVPHQEEQHHLKTMHILRNIGLSDAQIAVVFTDGGYITDMWYDRVKPRESDKWDSDMIRSALEHKPVSGM